MKHKFFESEDISDDEETYQISIPQTAGKENIGECDSPLLTSANQKRKLDKSLKKDSCLDFKMGKENVMTGKTETVGNVETKVSVMKNVSQTKKPKVSQFCAQKN